MKNEGMKDGDRDEEKGTSNCLNKYMESRRLFRECEIMKCPAVWELRQRASMQNVSADVVRGLKERDGS